MMRLSTSRVIHAPRTTVFSTIADIRQLSKALPHIIRYEFVSATQQGVGTRFRETRRAGGREATTELEVTEFVEPERIRLVADDHRGTVWDTTFSTQDHAHDTVLTLVMEARSDRWLARIMVLLIKPMIARAVGRDLDLVKAYCERPPELR